MGVSLLQTDPEEKIMKLSHVMEKLKSLDPKTFGMLNGMLDQAQAQGEAFIQVKKPDMEEQLMKLQPVLEKLHQLDPKSFGMQDRLAKIEPLMDKFKGLDPKTAGML